MKAYIGWVGSEWCMLIHGETPGKAKCNFVKWNPSTDVGFTDVSLIRLPGCDDKPFTYDNAEKAGFHYMDGDKPEDQKWFTNFCKCKTCYAKKEMT